MSFSPQTLFSLPSISIPLLVLPLVNGADSYFDAWVNHTTGDTYYLTGDETGQDIDDNQLKDKFFIVGTADDEGGRYTLKWTELYGTAMNVGVGGVLSVTDVIFDGYKNYFLQVNGGEVTSITNVDFLYSDAQAGCNGIAICLVANDNGSKVGSITNCSFYGNSTFSNGYDGGAIYIAANGSIGSITSSVFSNNSGGNGGAIYKMYEGSLGEISYCEFNNNTATKTSGYGGAIYSVGGALTVKTSSFSSNSAFYGGAITATRASAGWDTPEGGILTVSESSFNDNKATNSGGAIYLGNYSSLSVSDSSFTGNTSSGGGTSYGGGAICILSSSEAEITSSTFTSNYATYQGGAIMTASDLTLIDTSFYDNSAGTRGGAIYNNNKTISISAISEDVIFSGNTASLGGAIYNYNYSAKLNLMAAEGRSITFEDSIYSSSDKAAITIGSSEYTGSVYVYSEITNGIISLNGGELILGELTSDSLTRAESTTTQALLSSLTLNVAAGAKLTAIADCLGDDNTITNSGTLVLQSGTLSQSIGGSGAIQMNSQNLLVADGVSFGTNSWQLTGLQNSIGSVNSSNTIAFSASIEGDGIRSTSLTLGDGDFIFSDSISQMEIVLGEGDISLVDTVRVSDVKWSNLGLTGVANDTLTVIDSTVVYSDLITFTIDVDALSTAVFENEIIFSVTIDDEDALAAFEEACGLGTNLAFALEGFDADDLNTFDNENFQLWINGELIEDLEFATTSDGTFALCASIPEPSTATLSLLALTALLLRRRRAV